MNTRNSAMEVAEYLIEKGVVTTNGNEEIVSASCDGDDNLVIELGDEETRKVVVTCEEIRDYLNVNAYWESDPYNGCEKFFIVPQD